VQIEGRRRLTSFIVVGLIAVFVLVILLLLISLLPSQRRLATTCPLGEVRSYEPFLSCSVPFENPKGAQWRSSFEP